MENRIHLIRRVMNLHKEEKKESLNAKLSTVENEEKVLTQKVYFDSTGTPEEADMLKAVVEQKKSIQNEIKLVDDEILSKQDVYKTEAEKRLVELKENYGIMPKAVEYNPIKVPER